MDQTTARLLNRTERGLVLSEPIRAVDTGHPRGSLSIFDVSQKGVEVLNVTQVPLRRKHRGSQQHPPCKSAVRTSVPADHRAGLECWVCRLSLDARLLTSTALETRSLSMPLVEDNENMNHRIIDRQPPLPEHSTRSPNPNQVLPPPRKQPEQTHDKKETPCTSLLHGARVTTSRNSLDRIGRGLPDLLRGCAYADESESLKHRRPPPPGHAAKHHTQEPELSLEVGRQAGQGQGGES